MFKTLFLKECKQILKSISYYIFVASIVLFFVTQIGEFDVLVKPQVGGDNYGFKYSDDEDVIMKQSLKELILEFDRNSFSTYPVGFYKEVILNETKQEEMEDILNILTGLSMDEINKRLSRYYDGQINVMTEYGYMMVQDGVELDIQVLESISYDEYLVIMDNVDKLIGGGSSYHPKSLKNIARVPRSYEEAMEDYNSILKEDRVSAAYARQFSDYMGIVLGVLPVFLAVTRGLRDKRALTAETIYSKKASSWTIVLTRYFSTILMILVPLLILSISPSLQSLYFADSIGVKGDALAFVKYIMGWLLPTILFATSIGFFFTELTGGPLGILVQMAWWIVSVFIAGGNLVGYVGWSLVPRFNTVGKYSIYASIYDELVINRMVYSIASIVLLVLTVYIYSLKRKGVLNISGKLLPNFKSKSKI
ncbi:MAG: ABC transporter permease [Tissierella sp.]|nr:ABC transporter permease [Tissierella sp.]